MNGADWNERGQVDIQRLELEMLSECCELVIKEIKEIKEFGICLY